MNIKNKYYCRSKITEAKFRQLLRCFALDLTASNTAELIGISIRFTNSFSLKYVCEGAHRVRGKRGRGAYGKTIVFGL